MLRRATLPDGASVSMTFYVQRSKFANLNLNLRAIHASQADDNDLCVRGLAYVFDQEGSALLTPLLPAR